VIALLRTPFFSTRRSAVVTTLCVALLAASRAAAQTPPPETNQAQTNQAQTNQAQTNQAQTPADTSAPAPLLEELSRETERVVADTRDHLVVVRLPAPRWLSELAERDDPLLRWGQRLDPRVRQALGRERELIESGGEPSLRAYIEAAPGAPPSGPASAAPDESGANPDDAAADSSPDHSPPRNPQVDRLYGARAVGIWLDSGHVLIPLCVEPQAIGQAAILIDAGNGRSVRASIIGADRRTELTLLAVQMPATAPAGQSAQEVALGPATPLRLATRQPDRGSLILLVASGDQSAQLAVWAGGHDERGLVVDLNGAVAGLARPGIYMDAGDLRLTIGELARYGHVRRATLGVLVDMAAEPDGNPAVEIEKIDPQGPAAQAGVREGDFLLSIADRPVPDMASLGEAIVARDGPTPIQVLRAQQELTLSVMLAAR
jgi:S1-C subfamily serine protease